MANYIDKEKLTSHITDQNLKFTMLKCLDVVQQVISGYEIKNTKFLNPYETENLLSILIGIPEINYHIDGAYEQAERKLVYIYPDYYLPENIEGNISVIRITGNFKYREVSHRDYLGSILSLGITRENIGDICINKDDVCVILLSSMKDYILYNLEKISNVKIQRTEIKINELSYEAPEFEECIFSVSSLRLDVIIAGALNLSREKTQSLIKNERVRINYELVTSVSKLLKENSIISVKGHGRFIYAEALYETKKNKTRVLIRKYRK
ncbi:MAG: YlmH/Sll1252 family protein [Proteocatella sp.]